MMGSVSSFPRQSAMGLQRQQPNRPHSLVSQSATEPVWTGPQLQFSGKLSKLKNTFLAGVAGLALGGVGMTINHATSAGQAQQRLTAASREMSDALTGKQHIQDPEIAVAYNQELFYNYVHTLYNEVSKETFTTNLVEMKKVFSQFDKQDRLYMQKLMDRTRQYDKWTQYAEVFDDFADNVLSRHVSPAVVTLSKEDAKKFFHKLESNQSMEKVIRTELGVSTALVVLPPALCVLIPLGMILGFIRVDH